MLHMVEQGFTMIKHLHFENDIPELAKEFFDIKFEDYKNYENTM